MNRTGNYCAFYVKEPFSQSNLGANATRDFCYYNLLKAWKAEESSFPFVDSHNKNYNVRDDSSWETLKYRLRERLDASKNIILFLSDHTKESQALKEELDYGMGQLKLPVIVVYPDIKNKLRLNESLEDAFLCIQYQEKVPTFLKYKETVKTTNINMEKEALKAALNNPSYAITSCSTRIW